MKGEGAENETSTNGIKMDNYPSSGLLSSEERIRQVRNTVQFSVISDNFPSCPSYNHITPRTLSEASERYHSVYLTVSMTKIIDTVK